MNAWTIATRCLTPEAARAFASLDTVFALQGDAVARDALCSVLRVAVDGRRYYVKRYRAAGKRLRRWVGRPRVQAEWENLRRFADWGIPTPELVAWGLERRRGVFDRGALITAELEGARDLARLADEGDPRLADRRWVAELSRQLARIARSLHAHHFAHHDLKWRNLLVGDGPQPRLYLIDCPCGTFWRGPFLHYRVIRDLACLDKDARHHLSRTQRLRFYLDYVGRTRLTALDKRRLARIARFFAGRD